MDFTYKEDNNDNLPLDNLDLHIMEIHDSSVNSRISQNYKNKSSKNSEDNNAQTSSSHEKVIASSPIQKKRGRKRLYGHLIKKKKFNKRIIEEKTNKFESRLQESKKNKNLVKKYANSLGKFLTSRTKQRVKNVRKDRLSVFAEAMRGPLVQFKLVQAASKIAFLEYKDVRKTDGQKHEYKCQYYPNIMLSFSEAQKRAENKHSFRGSSIQETF